MKPYLFIDEKEWKYIMETYDKEDVVNELSKVLYTYPCPIPKFTDDDIVKSFNKLKSIKWNEELIEGAWFPRNITNSKYHLNFKDSQFYFRKNNSGNTTSNPFHIQNRWKVDWTRTPSGWKTWQSVDGIKTIVRAYWSLEKVLKKVDIQTIRMATTLRKYVASQFKPVVAKSFYDYFKSENVLDFSAGWGDRLAGFYAGNTTQHYVGIDPNTNNHPNYKKQVEFYKKYQTFFEEDKIVDLIPQPAEDVDYSKYKNHFDTIFTSPPYFDTEKYTDEDTQSYIRYKNIDDWNTKFLHTSLEKMLTTLKKGGIIAINIADVFYARTNDYVEITNPMNDFLKSKGLTYLGCIGMEMTKRFNSAGAGKTNYIDHDKNPHKKEFKEELKEASKENEGKKFGEPIWVWEK